MGKAYLSHLFKGSKYDLFEVVIDDTHLLGDFIDGLPESDQRKISALLKRTAELGPPRNKQKFKKLSNNLFEFKSYQIRIFCTFRGKSVLVLTHGIKKKKDKHDKKDMQKAKEILAILD